MVKRGRPPTPLNNYDRIAVFLPKDIHFLLREWAKELGLINNRGPHPGEPNVSELIRQILTKEVQPCNLPDSVRREYSMYRVVEQSLKLAKNKTR